MSGTLAALRQAATVLLAEAPLPVVRATLRALLADAEAPPAKVAAPPQPQKPKPKAAPTPKTADGEWDTRRREIRAARLDRGVSYNDLAEQFGVAVPTLRHALGRREPPTRAMRQRLEAWLESEPAPAVAEPPFRANGAGSAHAEGAERATAG